MNENEKLEKSNKSDNSILNMYSNVKQKNDLRKLIVENNEGILKELSKNDNKISSINGELNALQKNINKIQEEEKNKHINLENKLTSEVTKKIEDIKKETDELIEKIYIKMDENIKNIERSQQELANKIDVSDKDNNENLTKTEKNLFEKIELANKQFEQQLKNNKKQNDNLLKKSIENLKIDEIKTSITTLATSNSEKLNLLESELNKRLNALKGITESFTLTNVGAVRNEIKDLEQNINKKIANIDYTDNIKKIEISIKDLKQNTNKMIEDIDYSDTIKKFEISIDDLENKVNSSDYAINVLSDNVEKSNILNQKKLDTFKKEQEKYIISEFKKINKKVENNNLKHTLVEVNEKIEDLESWIDSLQEQNSTEIKNYVEKRISKMKYTSTIQLLAKEINELKKKVKILQASNKNEDTDTEKLEYIINKRLNKQKKEIMENIDAIVEERVQETIKEIMKKQKAKKSVQTLPQKQSYIDDYTPVFKKNTHSITRMDNAEPLSYNTRKRRNAPNSLDDMVATLSQLPDTSPRNTARKQLSSMRKAIKKSQLLNFDN